MPRTNCGTFRSRFAGHGNRPLVRGGQGRTGGEALDGLSIIGRAIVYALVWIGLLGIVIWLNS